jgi:hypothetical protein
MPGSELLHRRLAGVRLKMAISARALYRSLNHDVASPCEGFQIAQNRQLQACHRQCPAIGIAGRVSFALVELGNPESEFAADDAPISDHTALLNGVMLAPREFEPGSPVIQAFWSCVSQHKQFFT